MDRPVRDQVLVAAAAAVISFTLLGSAALWDEDEPLYASCAWEMLAPPQTPMHLCMDPSRDGHGRGMCRQPICCG